MRRHTTTLLFALLAAGLAGCGDEAEAVADADLRAYTLHDQANQLVLADDARGAIPLYEEAISLRPQDPILHLAHADALYMTQQLQAAVTQYGVAIHFAEQQGFAAGLPDAYFGRALAFQALGDDEAFHLNLDLAEAGFQRRADNPPGLSDRDKVENQVYARAQLAYVQYLRGDRDAAMAAAQSLLRDHPNHIALRDLVYGMQTGTGPTILDHPPG